MPESVMVLKNKGIDIGGHKSRPIDVAELRAADVVVAMTSVHVKELRSARALGRAARGHWARSARALGAQRAGTGRASRNQVFPDLGFRGSS